MFSGLIRVGNRERRIGAEGTAKLNVANSSSTKAEATVTSQHSLAGAIP